MKDKLPARLTVPVGVPGLNVTSTALASPLSAKARLAVEVSVRLPAAVKLIAPDVPVPVPGPWLLKVSAPARVRVPKELMVIVPPLFVEVEPEFTVVPLS